MLPFPIAPGTTPHDLFTRVLPEAHARLVPDGADEARMLVRVEGLATYALDARGSRLDVVETDQDRAPLWLCVARAAVEAALDDWTGKKRLVPRFEGGAMPMLTDPRLLKRLALASARVEVAIADFDGQRLAMTLGAGDAAKRGIDPEDPDTVVEATMDTVDAVLSGRLRPEDAIAEGRVALRGKKMTAMQIALALAPFLPR